MSLGSPNAKVTIDEWADFQCPACKAYTLSVESSVVSSYVRAGSVRIVFHDFAFIGAESTLAATAARCSGAQHHFWDYHGYLYSNQTTENSGRFNQAFLDQVADALGLDRTAFDACLTGGTARSQVVASTNQAQALNISQTPTFFIGNQQPIVGVPSFAQMSQVIDAALAAAGG
jgi:protein-disulfide isomerase